jgi:plastocyanin
MSKKFALLAILIMAFSVVLAACGGSSGSGSNGATTITATMTDFKFDPNSWTVPAGKSITLKLTNNGSVEHNWVLMAKPVTPPAPQSGSDILYEAKVSPGGTQTFTFTAPSTAGEYEVICNVAGHLEQGMSGKLVVTQP